MTPLVITNSTSKIDVKVSRKLTFNLGLRYEWDQIPRDKYGHLSGFDMGANAFVWGAHNPVTGQGPNIRSSIRDPDFNNFGPRFGFAYGLTPKTTLRGGYGLFYGPNLLWELQGLRGQWPFALSNSFQGLNRGLVNTPIEDVFPPSFTIGPGTPPSSTYSVARTDRTPYTQDFSLGVQREVARNLLLEVDYVATKGTKMPGFNIENTPQPGPGIIGSAQHPYPFPLVQNYLITEETRDSTTYHSLQVKLDKRFSNGLQFLGTYAYSHYIDIGGAGNSTQSFPQNPELHFNADKASGVFDFRHIFTAGYVYELPIGLGKHFLPGVSGVTNQLVGGWEITGLTHYNSGPPVNVTLTFDNANTSEWVEYPSRQLGLPARVSVPGDKTQGWLNPAAFMMPAPYTYGNLGRNTERGPGQGNWDFSLFKNFPLHGEKQKLQFRSEFFNLFNNVNLGSPSGGFCQPIATCNPNFGRIFGTQNSSREVQFALKLLF